MMPKLVLTEKYLQHALPLDSFSTPKQNMTKREKIKKEILKRNKLNLRYNCILPNPSVLQAKCQNKMDSIKEKVKESLSLSIQRFQNLYDPHSSKKSNSRLSNYKVYSALKRDSELEKAILKNLTPMVKKSKDIRNKIGVLQLRHLRKTNDQENLSKKVKNYSERRHKKKMKLLDEFIPSNREYTKAYTINNIEETKLPQITVGRVSERYPSEKILSDAKSNITYESMVSYGLFSDSKSVARGSFRRSGRYFEKSLSKLFAKNTQLI